MTTHPGLRHGAETIAALYDMQHDPPLEDMTYISPASGEPVGLSFIFRVPEQSSKSAAR